MKYSRVPKRADRLSLGLMTMLLAMGIARPASGQCEIDKLLASDGEVFDYFGRSVSVNGDLAIIGATLDDDNGPGSGSAYIFRFNPDKSEWVEEAKLLASDGGASHLFGGSVSICGDLAVVGAEQESSIGFFAGSAYIFRYDGTTWVEEAKLLASDGARYDRFGISVSVSGNIVVVGAKYNDAGGQDAGSAYVYRYDGMNWYEENQLLGSNGSWWNYFGTSVSVHEDVIAVGAYGYRTGKGATYIYRYDPDTTGWVEEAFLRASDPSMRDIFGISVSIHDDVLMVGAWLDDDMGEDSGSSYIFRYDGQAWHQEAKLLASDGEQKDAFGRSVSIWGDVAIASVNRDEPDGSDIGLGYLYRFDPDTSGWIEVAKLTTPDSEGHSLLIGRAVSVWGDQVFMGQSLSFHDDEALGSVHIFNLSNQAPSCPQDVVLNFWPPNHQYETIDVAAQAGVVDGDGNPVTITISSITQDEAINGSGDGNTSCDALILDDGFVRVRRERAGGGDGRVYVINYVAEDQCGETCLGSLMVEIPRDEFTFAIDSGQSFDATTCLSVADLNGDRIVNVSDMLILLGSFGQFGPAENGNMPDGDVDQDGDVDVSDLLMLLGEWG